MAVFDEYVLRRLVHPPSVGITPALDGDAVVVCPDVRVAHRHARRRVDVDAVAAGDVVFGIYVDAVNGESVGEEDVQAPERLVEDAHPADSASVAVVETDGLGASGKREALLFPFQSLSIDGALPRQAASLVVVEVEQRRPCLPHATLPARVDERVEGAIDDAHQCGTAVEVQVNASWEEKRTRFVAALADDHRAAALTVCTVDGRLYVLVTSGFVGDSAFLHDDDA